MTVSQKYLEFISLVKALNTIVLGDNTAEVTLDGITKPSISKFLAQVNALTTAELQRLRDAIDVVMNQQSVPTTIVTDGTHSQEWINSDFRASLLALNNWINTKGLPNGYASLDANAKVDPIYLPQATETALGVAKIATTAIAKAGTNDTDIVTAKKLRDALNATGNAPISACRAWLSVNTVTSTILQSFNIASFVRTATGQFEITFTTPMPHKDYVAFTNSLVVKGAGTVSNTVGVTFNSMQTNTVSRCYMWCWSTSNGSLISPEVLNVGVFC